jgi:biopolymer transport protein ExbD
MLPGNIKRAYTRNRHVMNFVPFIDVVFMLLIYFFVAAEIRPTEADFETNLPPGMGQLDRKVPAKEPFRIIMKNLNTDGTKVSIELNGTSMGEGTEEPGAADGFQKLEGILKAVPKKDNMIVIIDGEPNLRMQIIARALDAAMAAEAPSITFGRPKTGS